jgi:hypothetical protein
MKLNTLMNYMMVKESDKASAFYASDFNLSGGEIAGMRHYGMLEATGNKKEIFVEIGDDLYKKAYVNEWRLVDNSLRAGEMRTIFRELDKVNKHFNQLVTLLNGLDGAKEEVGKLPWKDWRVNHSLNEFFK